MDIERVDPELREATRKLGVPPIGSALGRRVVRAAIRVMRVPRIDGVTVSVQRPPAGTVRIDTP